MSDSHSLALILNFSWLTTLYPQFLQLLPLTTAPANLLFSHQPLSSSQILLLMELCCQSFRCNSHVVWSQGFVAKGHVDCFLSALQLLAVAAEDKKNMRVWGREHFMGCFGMRWVCGGGDEEVALPMTIARLWPSSRGQFSV